VIFPHTGAVLVMQTSVGQCTPVHGNCRKGTGGSAAARVAGGGTTRHKSEPNIGGPSFHAYINVLRCYDPLISQSRVLMVGYQVWSDHKVL
jgi:hypothetical protein